MKIIRSPIFHSLKDYLSKPVARGSKLYLFVPYIKTASLRQLLSGFDLPPTVIVTTWKPEDLLQGISELSLYDFCKQNRIALYVNNSLHLKIYCRDMETLILATANISAQGLGTISSGNLECAVLIDNLTNEDRLFFSQIIRESWHIDEEIYESVRSWIGKQEYVSHNKVEQFEKIIRSRNKEQFLISALPMTRDVTTLMDCYDEISQGREIRDKEIRDCVFHDLANYHIPIGLQNSAFKKQLKESFFSHPFIIRIDSLILEEAYFGQIKAWVQRNCTDVPVPSRRALTGNVQVLFKWFEQLGEGRYKVDVPGSYSQRIRKM